MFLKKRSGRKEECPFLLQNSLFALWLVQHVQLEDQMKGFGRVWKGMKGYGRVWKGSTVNPFEPFHTLPYPSKPFQTPSFHPEPTLPTPKPHPQHHTAWCGAIKTQTKGAEGCRRVWRGPPPNPSAPLCSLCLCFPVQKPPSRPISGTTNPLRTHTDQPTPPNFGWFGYRWPQENVIHNHTKHRFFVRILISKYNVQQV